MAEEVKENVQEEEQSQVDMQTEDVQQEVLDEQLSEDESCEEDESAFLKSRIETLEKEKADYKDQFMRKHADFENYRKRMTKEKADSVKYGNQGLLKDLIEIIDNFDRAIKSADDSADFTAFREGISMIEQQFTGMLQSKWGLEKMSCVGSEYDPNAHEALMMEESTEVEVPTVLEDYQAGYKLYERVIRPSKVKVGKPAVAASDDK